MASLQSVSQSRHPDFWLGSVPVFGRMILAPMDGYSDLPFRTVTRALGSAISITEFINAMEVLSRNTKYERRCQFSDAERPVGIQLFDDSPERIIKAALKISAQFHPDFIDINMGCSVNHVSSRGAGAGLLLEPKKIQQIISQLTASLSIPITAKIRLGWDDAQINYLETGKIIQECGAKMIALHARTREQLFNGSADWDAIAHLKQALSIPVIGNGDILTPQDFSRMVDYTKCDAVMIGRAAIANPWIFSGFQVEDVPYELFTQTVFQHFDLMKAHFGPERGCVVFRKYAKKYLTARSVPKERIRNLLTTVNPNLFTEKFTQLVESTRIKDEESRAYNA